MTHHVLSGQLRRLLPQLVLGLVRHHVLSFYMIVLLFQLLHLALQLCPQLLQLFNLLLKVPKQSPKPR